MWHDAKKKKKSAFDFLKKSLFFKKKILTCNMLRLNGAGLFHERILTVKCENCLVSPALGPIPSAIRGVVTIVEMNDVVTAGGVSFARQPILLSPRLETIDHLDWSAGGGRKMWRLHNNPEADESFCSCFSYWRLPVRPLIVFESTFRKPTPSSHCCDCLPRV